MPRKYLNIHRKFLLLLLLLKSGLSFSQSELHVDHVYHDNGQKIGQIHSIVKDHFGYVWIGAESGLYRYDSKSIIPASDLFTATPFPNAIVHEIREDKQGKLWVSTHEGLFVIDGNRLSFERIYPKVNDIPDAFDKPWVHRVFTGTGDEIWFGNHFGLNAYNVKTGKRITYPIYDSLHIPFFRRYASFFSVVNDRYLLIGTNDGVCRFDLKLRTYHQLRLNTEKSIPDEIENVICSHFQLNDSIHYFGTWAAGLKIYNERSGSVTTQLYTPGDQHPGTENIVLDIVRLKTNQEEILMGTADKGLALYNTRTATFHFFGNINSSPYSIDNSYIHTLYADPEDNVWIGTNTGLQLYSPLRKVVRYYKLQEKIPDGASNEIISMAHDSLRSTVYLATISNGIWSWNYSTDKVKKESVISGGIFFPAETMFLKDDHLFLCSNGRIYPYDIRRNKLQQGILFPGGSPVDYEEIDDSTLCLFSIMRAPVFFNPRTRKITPMSASISGDDTLLSQARCIQQVNEHQFLIGTYRHGLILFDKQQQKVLWDFKYYNGIPVHDILDIILDKSGQAWFCTLRMGLFRLNLNTRKADNFRTFNGTVINSVYALAVDRNQHLWVATNSGLLNLDPTTLQSRLLSEFDGLETNKLQNGLYFLSNGQLVIPHYFGFSVMTPSQLQAFTEKPLLRINSVKVNDRLIQPSDEKLHLSYNENNIEVEFAVLSYVHARFNRYYYKLEGVHEKWIDNENNNRVILSELPPGDYTLLLRAANSDGNINAVPLKLFVHIGKPFWNTYLFYALMVLLVLGFIYLFVNMRIRQLKKVQRIRNKIASDLHDEVGSALSSIKLYSGFIKHERKSDTQLAEVMGRIENTSKESLENMSDIVWSINAKNDTLEKLLSRMKSFSDGILLPAGIKVHYDLQVGNIPVHMESRRQLYLFYKEAVNNIAKYAVASNVWISLLRKGAWWELEIKDDGAGFDASAVQDGNGLQNMEERAVLLNGNCMVETAPGKGTCVKLRFKTT